MPEVADSVSLSYRSLYVRKLGDCGYSEGMGHSRGENREQNGGSSFGSSSVGVKPCSGSGVPDSFVDDDLGVVRSIVNEAEHRDAAGVGDGDVSTGAVVS